MRNPILLPSLRKRQKERGSVLVICMVLAALGTIGVAAWIALLDARGNQVETHIASLQQRASDRNSQALAYRALYANHLSSASASTSSVIYQLPDNLGKCTIAGYASAPLQNVSSIRVSNNGATPVRSYTTDVTVTLPSGTGTRDWQYQLRSFNPVLGGDLLTVHPPFSYDDNTPLVQGKLIIEGRALFWDAIKDDFSAEFQADELVLPNEILGTTTFTNTAGNKMLPLNYPIPRQTTGLPLSGTPYEGKIDIFENGSNSANSYYHKIVGLGNHVSFDPRVKKSKGKGPSTKAPKDSDADIEALIESMNPAQLVDELQKYIPLSSALLQKVLEKDNPSFNDKQLLQVLNDQDSVANDVLTELESVTHEDRVLEEDKFLFHENNKTIFTNNGNAKVKIFLNRSDLPNVVLRNITDLRIYGQNDDTKDANAATYPPRIILIMNDSSTTETNISFRHKNSRPIILAIASDPTAPGKVNFEFKGSDSFPEWHSVIELKNTTAEFDANSVSEAILIGGIRTNQPVHILSGTLRIKQQFEPKGLETLLSRNAWIEAYQL